MRCFSISLLLAGAACTAATLAAPQAIPPVSHAPVMAARPTAQTPAPSDILHIAAGVSHQRITVAAGKTLIVDLPAPAREVLVTEPKIAAAIARTPQQIFITGHGVGDTNGFVFDAKGKRMLSLDIHVDNGSAELATMLNSALPGAHIDVLEHHGEIILTGSVVSASQSLQAEQLAGSAGGAGGSAASSGASASGASGTGSVINALKVTGAEQVMLKVRVAEMQRSVSKQLGINLAQSATTLGATVISASTDNPYGIVGSALSDSSQVAISNGNLSGTMKALESVGLAHSLAEPNLIAVSGETAKFLAGGEFPVASGRDSSGNVSVEFKQYGVGLSFTPVVLGPGRISLKLSTEVSELTNTGSLTVSTGTTTTSSDTTTSDSDSSNSTTIPALTVRRAETTIELPSGGSFAIAGLMQHTTKQQIEGFPGLKDLPVLGALFRSRDFENNETELVVLVTAYLVHPTAPKNLATPTDGFVVPSDPSAILLGRLNTLYGKDFSQSPSSSNAGFIVK